VIPRSINGSAARPIPVEEPRRVPRPGQRPAVKPASVPKTGLRAKVASICLVLAFFALFAVLISRFAYISEVNEGLKVLKHELADTKEETQKLKTKLNMALSLDEVRTRAGYLEMDTPGEDQKVYVKLPEATKAPSAAKKDPKEHDTGYQGIFDMLLSLLD
jgi:hypothetical protein